MEFYADSNIQTFRKDKMNPKKVGSKIGFQEKIAST
jgi:hypothetical protein